MIALVFWRLVNIALALMLAYILHYWMGSVVPDMIRLPAAILLGFGIVWGLLDPEGDV